MSFSGTGDVSSGLIHHRAGTHEGFGDLELTARRSWDWGSIAFGTTVPTGRTERNPFPLARLGIRHTHLQFGTGTFDPIVRADAQWMPDRIGLSASLSARLPFYENSKGYQAGPSLALFAGPIARPLDRLTLSAGYGVIWQSVDLWDGHAASNSGQFTQGVYFNASVRIADDWTLAATAWHPTDIEALKGAAYEQDWLIGVSLTWGGAASPSAPTGTASTPE